uniref:Uncharacterized protein n=1 Tax=Arundo donax TaxID=35708 RepID=A0A0A8Z3S7_ARUDO
MVSSERATTRSAPSRCSRSRPGHRRPPARKKFASVCDKHLR